MENKRVTFTFEEEEMVGYEGEPIAAALWRAGIRHLGHSMKLSQARGMYCGEGWCQSCLVEVDGRRNVRSCQEPVRPHMVVKRGDPHASL
ncbi:MAG: (2Fe-2S)-binding protein [Bacillota bacterium]